EVRPVRSADTGPLVPVQPQPPQSVENAGDHVGGGALDVRIFDAQHEDAAVAPGVQPVEQRRARTADVEITGRGRRKPNAWDHAPIISCRVRVPARAPGALRRTSFNQTRLDTEGHAK